MTEHRRLRYFLYDYLRGEVGADLRVRIERHLESCHTCAEETKSLRSVIETTARGVSSPSSQQGEEFWRAFPYAVEEKIRREKVRKETLSDGIADFFTELFLYRRRSFAFLGGGLVIGIAAGIALLRTPPPAPASSALEAHVTPVSVTPVVEVDRMQKYFRRSRLLLVGIQNMRMTEDEPVDLTVEQNTSRELLQEARYLRYQLLDNRSAKLIGDLEKILIELANIKEETGLPNVEILRGGIHQENLLFKIRMAEAIYDTTKFMKANYTPLRNK